MRDKNCRVTYHQGVRNPEQNLKQDRESLIAWYENVRRPLPWRRSRDPYPIWISEVMLQQTTVAAVIPYFERFMLRFPTLKSLASASIEDVIEMWAGLGYYSRARNLHKASQALHANGFPRTSGELAQLPGFGPYTSRAVASLAFGEKSGVLDGNVIRVLSRRFGLKLEWWKPRERERLQELADQLAQTEKSSELNQGLMELGATVCTPRSASCLICPWVKACVARKDFAVDQYPLPKPRRAAEMWLWSPTVIYSKKRVLLVPNTYSPFLKGHLTLPGTATKLKDAPKKFDFRGGVTHHDIFVRIELKEHASARSAEKEVAEQAGAKWVSVDALKKDIPASLIRKAISSALNKGLESKHKSS